MTRIVLCRLFGLVLFLSVYSADADPLQTGRTYSLPVGANVQFLQEQGVPLTVEQVLAGDFQASDRPVLSFGIGAPPVWLKLEVHNDSTQLQTRQLLFETSWLDRLDAYWFREGRLLTRESAGDRQVYSHRAVSGRHHAFEHAYVPGTTTVLLRVESVDPMNLPLFFYSPQESADKVQFLAYSYGLLYGAVLSLLLYNLMLFAGLKELRYLYFSIYLGTFIAMNVAYTGHGFQAFWPDSVY